MLANDYFDNMKQPMSTWKLARPWWGCLVWPTASRKCPRWTRRVFSQGCGRSWARVELDNPSPQRVAKKTCCLHSFMPENSHHIMMIFTQNHLIFHSDSPSRYTALSAVAAFGSVLALASLWVMVEVSTFSGLSFVFWENDSSIFSWTVFTHVFSSSGTVNSRWGTRGSWSG